MKVRCCWMDGDRWRCAPYLLPEGASQAYVQGRRLAGVVALEVVEADDPDAPVMDDDGIVWCGGHRAFPLEFDQSPR